MDRELAAFLEHRAPDFGQSIAWREHRLALRGYFTADAPPDAFVLAGRALVLKRGRVLVGENQDGKHVIPGGRRKPGETALDAARREVVEETAWSICNPSAFSVIHFRYETPAPVSVGRVIYPDFLWQVFLAEPAQFDPKARDPDGYERGGAFRSMTEALKQPLQPFERVLLARAASASALSAPQAT